LLIARNRLCAAYLSEQMQKGNIRKAYVAILRGRLPADSGTIDTYMRRTEQSIIVREVCDENGGGDRAITEYRVLCASETHTLVRATPITGRTHQLRVHFAHLGCPIEGDDLYGEPSEHIGRHALHSFMLSFPSKGGEMITVHAPMHDDMLSVCREVFGDKLYTTDEETLKYILPQSRDEDNEI
jgi:23S rRNA pseudouridine1911/1915/1917 synthase